MISRDSMKLLDRKCARETRSGYLRRKEVIADECDIKEKPACNSEYPFGSNISAFSSPDYIF